MILHKVCFNSYDEELSPIKTIPIWITVLFVVSITPSRLFCTPNFINRISISLNFSEFRTEILLVIYYLYVIYHPVHSSQSLDITHRVFTYTPPGPEVTITVIKFTNQYFNPLVAKRSEAARGETL